MIEAGSAETSGQGGMLTVPLSARGRPIGALTLANEGSRPLDPVTLDVARELAGRIAVAVDHARSYRQQVRLSRTLQASLLPPSLPEIPGMELAALYAAGGAGVDVGGDFYDVFSLDPGRFVLVVGDVCGRGIDAATTASLVRHTIRSAALTDPSPAAILTHLNDVLLRESEPDRYEPRFCTAVVALVARTRPTPTVTLAVGGHPLPVVRRADAHPEQPPPRTGPGDAHIEAPGPHLPRQALGVGAAGEAAQLHHPGTRRDTHRSKGGRRGARRRAPGRHHRGGRGGQRLRRKPRLRRTAPARRGSLERRGLLRSAAGCPGAARVRVVREIDGVAA